MEAASAHVPVVAVASQIPRDLIGKGRGYLHELRDQKACVAQIVKWAETARHPSQIPSAIAAAWETSLPPSIAVTSWTAAIQNYLQAVGIRAKINRQGRGLTAAQTARHCTAGPKLCITPRAFEAVKESRKQCRSVPTVDMRTQRGVTSAANVARR